jgi:hypothetical protein
MRRLSAARSFRAAKRSKEWAMTTRNLTCAGLVALLLASTSADAAVGDYGTGIATANESVVAPARYYHRYHSRYHRYYPLYRMRPDYQRACRYGMRLQPFPTYHGYRYACVPWR